MSSEKSSINPKENTYSRKELMTIRPAIVEQIKEWGEGRLSARSLSNHGANGPNYKPNFIGKGLSIFNEMGLFEQQESGKARPNQYIREEGPEVDAALEAAQEMAEEVYTVRIVNALENIEDPEAAIEYVKDPGLKITDNGDRPEIVKYRSENYEDAEELLDQISIIHGGSRKTRWVTADKRDIRFFEDRIAEWEDVVETLEEKGEVPERFQDMRKKVKEFYE